MTASGARVDGAAVEPATRKVGDSAYATVYVEGVGVHSVEIALG